MTDRFCDTILGSIGTICQSLIFGDITISGYCVHSIPCQHMVMMGSDDSNLMFAPDIAKLLRTLDIDVPSHFKQQH